MNQYLQILLTGVGSILLGGVMVIFAFWMLERSERNREKRKGVKKSNLKQK